MSLHWGTVDAVTEALSAGNPELLKLLTFISLSQEQDRM